MTRGIRRHCAGPLSLALLGAMLTGCVPMVVGTAVVGGAIVATDRRAGGSAFTLTLLLRAATTLCGFGVMRDTSGFSVRPTVSESMLASVSFFKTPLAAVTFKGTLPVPA